MSTSMSEGLHYDRIQQGHMLSSSDWQLVCSVVVDDLRDSREGRAVLSEHVTPICRLGELHVHEALTTPDRERRKKVRFIFSYLIQPKLDFCDIYRARLKVQLMLFSDQTFTTRTACPDVLQRNEAVS